jgi:hypothetical protein
MLAKKLSKIFVSEKIPFVPEKECLDLSQKKMFVFDPIEGKAINSHLF